MRTFFFAPAAPGFPSSPLSALYTVGSWFTMPNRRALRAASGKARQRRRHTQQKGFFVRNRFAAAGAQRTAHGARRTAHGAVPHRSAALNFAAK